MDRRAIDNLYRQHGPFVLRCAHQILHNEQAAQDARQEVFVRALQSGSGFRADASPMTWLYRITANCANTHLTRRRKHRHEELTDESPLADTNAEQVVLQLDKLVDIVHIRDISHEEIVAREMARRTGLDLNGARVAVWVIPNNEVFALNEAMPGGTGKIPDVPTWAARDYGARVGVFRIMDVLSSRGIRASVTLNSEVCYEGLLGRHDEQIQRIMAWTSLLAGTAGYTYGGNGIWQVNRIDNSSLAQP